jgi:hypothetical protein
MAMGISCLVQAGGIHEFGASIFEKKPGNILVSRKMRRLEGDVHDRFLLIMILFFASGWAYKESFFTLFAAGYGMSPKLHRRSFIPPFSHPCRLTLDLLREKI